MPKTEAAIDPDPETLPEEQLDLAAMSDHAAGRVVPHAAVTAWLDSWGRPDELPIPEPKAR